MSGRSECIALASGDGPALTAAVAASCLPAGAKVTLPKNFWQVGRALHIRASGRISSVITTPGTARYDVRYGGNVIFDGLAIALDAAAAHTNVPWHLDVLLQCRAVGAAGNVFGQGMWTCNDMNGLSGVPVQVGASAMLPWNVAPAVGANFDTTAAGVLDLFFTQTVATGSMTLHQYSVWASSEPIL